jgi:hypothetical protein
MSAGRALGALLLVVGLALIVVGVAGAAGTFGDGGATPTPAVTAAAPTASAVATEPPMSAPLPTAIPTPTPSPTAAPTADVDALVRAFYVELGAALDEGRAGDMVDALAPAVFDRYGRPACEAQLASQAPEPGRAFEILAIGPPSAWDYVTDDVSTTIPDALTIQARVTGPSPTGETTVERELHVQVINGVVRWFSDCGTPLG